MAIIDGDQIMKFYNFHKRFSKNHFLLSGMEPSKFFTAAIHVTVGINDKSQVMTLIKQLLESTFCNQIVILWNCELEPPSLDIFPQASNTTSIELVEFSSQVKTSNKFQNRHEYKNE